MEILKAEEQENSNKIQEIEAENLKLFKMGTYGEKPPASTSGDKAT